MKHLKLYEDFIFEGGNAFDDIQSYKSDDKDKILNKVSDFLRERLGLSKEEFVTVGSFKNITSGKSFNDLDVVVKANNFMDTELETFEDVSKVLSKIEEKLNKSRVKTRKFPSIGLVTCRMRVDDGKYIQLDIFPVNSLDWGESIYYSPNPKATDYKGLYRNALFEALAKSIHFNQISYENEEPPFKKGDIKQYNRYRFIRNLGLWTVVEENVGKRKLVYKKIQDTYEKVTDDYDEFIRTILGEYSREDVKTFDQVWNIITKENYKHTELIPKIIENFEIIIVDRLKEKLPEVVQSAKKIYTS